MKSYPSKCNEKIGIGKKIYVDLHIRWEGDLPHPAKNMSHKTEHVGHWEDLETWLSVVTDSLHPKAAETLKHQTQDQLDDKIASLRRQDPSQSYSHKELAKITGSLSHTLIATLILSDKHTAQRQQELTSAQRRIEQLELVKLRNDRKGPIRWNKALRRRSTG